jgi:hypothetical protein
MLLRRYIEVKSSIAMKRVGIASEEICTQLQRRVVKAYALELGTRLIFIPPGMTDVYEPLDRQIFGHLKQ